MLYQGKNEVKDFFWLHMALGRNESTKHFMSLQRHRKERQWLPAHTQDQKAR